MLKKNLFRLLLLILLFLVALFPRIYKLNETEIYPDEITWTIRSREAFLAIKTKNFQYFKTAWWNDQKETQAINLPGALLSGASIFFLAKGQPTHYSLEILPDYLAARVPIVVLSTLFVPIFFVVAHQLTRNRTTALLASLMFALDPIFLGLSRWQLTDVYLMVWTFLSLSAYLLIKKTFRSVLFSSFFLALAFLTKPTALLLLVVFILYSPKKFVPTLLAFIVITHVLWLGSNNWPGLEIIEYTQRQFRLSHIPISVFFNGQVTANPPFYYYLYQLGARLPVLTLIGLAAALFYKKLHALLPEKKLTISIFLFVALYVVAMSFSPEKLGVRYVFPIFPWLYIISATAITALVSTLKKQAQSFVCVLCVIPLVATAITYFPNYYLFYNSLVGGPGKAQKHDLVGLCMGAKDAVRFIEEKHKAGSVAYIGCNKTVIPYYSTIGVTTDWENEKFVIIEESYKTLSPEKEAVVHFQNKKPIFVNSKNGAILSRVYSNN